jgi:hypothetical protein
MVKSKKPKKEKNEFWELVQEIRGVATQRMDYKERRKFMEKQAKRLGAKPKKNPKIPYNIYQGILKKEKEMKKKAKEDYQLSRESGFYNPVERKKERPKLRNPQPTAPSVGNYKAGTLFINKKMFKEHQGSAKNRHKKFR